MSVLLGGHIAVQTEMTETAYNVVLYDSQNCSTYPHKHVQFVLTSFFKLLDLRLARVADVQMIDSWATSIPTQQ